MKKLHLRKLTPKLHLFVLALLLCSFGVMTAATNTNAEIDTSADELFQSTVTGTITDENGIPLSGASVVVKGTTTGAVADFDGN